MTVPSSADTPWASGPYSIKRHGTTIENCDAEPIQTPGCIQSHGVLMLLRQADLKILQVSDNSAAWLGISPEDLLGNSIATVLRAEGEARLKHCLETEILEKNPIYALTLTLPEQSERAALDVSVHTLDGVVLVEFEATGRGPNPVEPDYYALLKKTIAKLHAATHVADFCQRVTEEFRELTGLDRVMVYRFHPDDHGEVLAESARPDLPSWLGLHYPAEDIPKPAREIFKKIWIRPLPDAEAPLMELVPLANPDTGLPTDMTYCALRGVSIMHSEYLRNMGVAATLTLPILNQGELWGLIACHHYTPTQFPYQIRAASEFLAQSVSFQLRSVEEREDLLDRLRIDDLHSRLITAATEGDGKLEALLEGEPNLLDGLEAGGVALHYDEHWWRVGETPTEEQLGALAKWLSTKSELQSTIHPIYATDHLRHDYPEVEALVPIASGLLALRLSTRHDQWLIWFRPETVRTIRWAGSPHDKPTVPGPHGPRLTPRVSFELFLESVSGKSLPWKTMEIEAAQKLRVWIMELVIARIERLAALNADLVRSNLELDTFNYVVSLDLKEPLRGIAKYAQQILASDPDPENEQRTRSQMRLIQRMESLLNALLRFSRIGRSPQQIDHVDLNTILEEALIMAGARREAAEADIVVDAGPKLTS